MEKVLSVDERIKRAEEIYYRRKSNNIGEIARVNVNTQRKNWGLLKKMILQILICVFIYISIYLIQTTNYIFSDDVLTKAKEIVSYDIDFNNLFNDIHNYINGLLNKEVIEESQIEETVENKLQEENVQEEVLVEELQEELTQEEQDIKYVTENISLIVPLKGTITSRYGPRESDNPIVSKYHTGIDIAVNSGTTFCAAMSGTVTLVSNEGCYRDTCCDNKWRGRDIICTLSKFIYNRR